MTIATPPKSFQPAAREAVVPVQASVGVTHDWPWVVNWVECGVAKRAGMNARFHAYDLVAYLESHSVGFQIEVRYRGRVQK